MKSQTVERNCTHCDKLFNAPIAEINRGNARYCSLSCAAHGNNAFRQANPRYNKHCIHCGKEFITDTGFHTYCSDRCKSKSAYERRKRSRSICSLYLFDLPCAICGWKESTRDLHHIVPIANNGTNTDDNLITLCPNHHRMTHRNLITQDKLFELVKSRTMSSTANTQLSDALAGN